MTHDIIAAWTPADVKEIILILFAQISAAMVLYFKLKNQAEKRAKSVKEEVAKAAEEIKASNAVTAREVNGMLRSMIDSAGAPAWVKVAIVSDEGNVTFRMLHLNREFEDAFNVRVEDYAAKTDFQIWPEETANQFYLDDLEVFSTGVPKTYTEIIKGKPMRFRKICIIDRVTGKRKGVHGFSVDYGDPATQSKHKTRNESQATCPSCRTGKSGAAHHRGTDGPL